MGMVRLVIPEEPVEAAATQTETRALNRRTLRLGVLDNSKGNADHLLTHLVARLREESALASVVWKRKPAAARPAEESVLAQLAEEADCVISAMAD